MAPKLKNAIIFLAIAAVFVLIYVFFIKSPVDTGGLVSSSAGSTVPVVATTADNTGDSSSVAQDFLTLLLNINNIKLNDSIFSDNAFASLHDSSITLVPDGTEGRPNPFAPIGVDVVVPSQTNTTATGASTGTSTPISPNAGAGATGTGAQH